MAYKEPVFTKEAMAALQASWNDNSGRKSTAKTKKRTTAPKKAAGKKPAAKKGK